MNKVKLLHALLGKTGTRYVVNLRNRALHIKGVLLGYRGAVAFNDGRTYKRYAEKGKNVFFGYYDLSQYDSEGKRLLAHVVRRGADPSRDPADIVWYDVSDGKSHTVAQTKAWCWQQGARLRWHPLDNNKILYNDLVNGRYVLKSRDINTSAEMVVSRALYDLDGGFTHGLSLNFERLQRLRPGYGYCVIGDNTSIDSAPADDGVFYVDIESGKDKLLFSLRELAKDICASDAQHYINHLSISPSGKRFTFFHIWTKNASAQWNMRFYAADICGANMKMLEDGVRVSHYCWLDDDNILATRRVVDKEFSYVVYDIQKDTKRVLNSTHMDRDGHPSVFGGSGVMFDTYPLDKHMQYLYCGDMSIEKDRELLHIYSEPLCFGEHRCDLHPRVFKDRYVTLDTTCFGKERCIIAFELNEQDQCK